MELDIDVLIIHAEKDNQESASGDNGWISQFKKFLEMMLVQMLGRKPHIVVLSENDNLAAAIDQSVVLISILSEDFIRSGQCLDAVEAFYKSSKASEKNQITRLFKVFKTFIPNVAQPRRLRDLIGYEMYQTDIETTEVSVYTDFFSPQAEKQFWMKLVDLAYDVHETIININNDHVGETKEIFRRKTIYLAETSHDLSIQRNIIRRELIRHGYNVLPNHTLPDNITDLQLVVKQELKKSNMSIHLIGKSYGEIPEGSEVSIVELQNQLAVETTNEKRYEGEDFSRLIWISPAVNNLSEIQTAFINNLRRETETQIGAEILQNPLEDFKNLIREELMQTDLEESSPIEGQSIYLMYDSIDAEDVKPLKDVIENEGFKVLEPIFAGDLLMVRKRHIENLRNMDAAVIFKNKINEQWVRMKILDILKAPGFGRSKPIRGKGIIAIGSREQLDQFRGQQLELISGDLLQLVEDLKLYVREL